MRTNLMGTQTAVFQNLMDAQSGEKIAHSLLEETLTGPKKRILHVLGQPASGKTTIIGQFTQAARKTAKDNDMNLTIRTSFFDKIQSDAERILRIMDPKKLDSSYWGPGDWQLYEKIFEEAIVNPKGFRLDVVASRSTRHRELLTIETPYILYSEKHSNGRRIFNKIAKRNHGAIYLYVIGDQKTTVRTMDMRQAVAGSKNGIAAKINKDYGIIPVGFGNSRRDSEELISIVERMAPPEAFFKIKSKTRQIAQKWLSQNSQSNKLLDPIVLPDSYISLPEAEQEEYRIEAAYMTHVFRKELRLSPKISKVVFNPDIPSRKIYMYLKLLGD